MASLAGLVWRRLTNLGAAATWGAPSQFSILSLMKLYLGTIRICLGSQFCISSLLNSYLETTKIGLGSSRPVLYHFLKEFLFGNHRNLSEKHQTHFLSIPYSILTWRPLKPAWKAASKFCI